MSEEREGFAKSTPDEVRRGKTHMMVGDEHGQVFIRFPQPMQVVVLDPQNAFQIAEAMARAAHKAKFGVEPPSDQSYLAAQVKSRLTEEMRDRLVARVTILLNNRDSNPKTPGYWALQIVDTVFAAVE